MPLGETLITPERITQRAREIGLLAASVRAEGGIPAAMKMFEDGCRPNKPQRTAEEFLRGPIQPEARRSGGIDQTSRNTPFPGRGRVRHSLNHVEESDVQDGSYGTPNRIASNPPKDLC